MKWVAMDVTVIYECPLCGRCGNASEIELVASDVARWKAGELIQNVWPEMTAAEREVIVSGTHPECWREIFGED